jgi:hypothetical protein
MHRIIVFIAGSLALAACAQIASFEQKAAPVIGQACATFHKAEANPLVHIALAGGTLVANIAAPGSGTAIGAGVALVRSYGDKFCAEGPPAGDATTPDQQAAWLAGIVGKMLAAAGH